MTESIPNTIVIAQQKQHNPGKAPQMKNMLKLFALAAAVVSLQACGVAEAQDNARPPEESVTLNTEPGEAVRRTEPGAQGIQAPAKCEGDDGSTCGCAPGVICIATGGGCCCGCSVTTEQTAATPDQNAPAGSTQAR
ncbi:hypothetical protein OV208_11305 [Corallococcus sp. bb12-1]|uniref:hypothetical protein n=1 Tax=Corallococcus sp. bb12-1 TaxID=2996784 RepID=UPI00226D4B63|nr:hypothetical protein [Corallococcus sp. bb12-1]MCY1041901.1 hypothetical protein [Corallococcus sp. bb12-1]